MKNNKLSLSCCLLLLLTFSFSCNQPQHILEGVSADVEITLSPPPPPVPDPVIPKPEMCLKMERMGLVDVRKFDKSIRVVLAYSSDDNFTGKVLYESSQHAYLQVEVARMLAKASQLLQEAYPTYRLLVLDAARPVSVQQVMWDVVKGTPNNIYVANPKKTGLHNYGAAVDITITNDLGVPLDMGTPFDCFDQKAQPAKEKQMLKEGKLSQQQIDNREILRTVMNNAGFLTYHREWWHFNACKLAEAKAKYQVIP
ncbi:MAG: M15 family metallopeptidase [Bacteroidales bacterium]|jgi:D-alanyl-D-alanine dipeptidase|nr:M15 family metallopeptidase [Bacteroidales bacterium]